jgi:phospholipid/cholesterol/gamma-HCH transport system substrate-binding protein
VRQVGQIGLTNRYIELDPGPTSAPAIPDGGTLPEIQTRPSIDFDVFLDTFDPKMRAALKKLLKEGSHVFAGRTRAAQRAFAYLNPGLGQSRLALDELARDPHAFRQLVTTSSALASALASRQTDLQQGIGNTAAMLRALAAETTAMGDAIGRAPAVLRQGQATFTRLNGTLAQLNPALAELRPSAAPLARLLRLLPPTARDATPAFADLRAVLPPTARALRALPALARVAVPALRSSTTAIRAGQPIFTGLRPYSQELAIGISSAFGGAVAGYYDANGHYGRLGGVFNPGPGGFTGPLAVLSPKSGLSGFTGFRSGLTARCPGAVMEPAPDGSNPWIPDPSLCDPEDQHQG